ncbi:MAG: hypothetical protein IIC13_15840 [SAR324 cluster bacterium]|nr:hypothetical protein [SAR324 cluster bacterium]MCH8888054.1 hypothetical protein [SAR324 cluster bacterium]
MSQKKSRSDRPKARRGESKGKIIAKRRWVLWSTLLVFAVFVGATLMAMTVTGQSRGEPVADFTVDTAQGPLSMASQKGNILIYFFSFPG